MAVVPPPPVAPHYCSDWYGIALYDAEKEDKWYVFSFSYYYEWIRLYESSSEIYPKEFFGRQWPYVERVPGLQYVGTMSAVTADIVASCKEKKCVSEKACASKCLLRGL